MFKNFTYALVLVATCFSLASEAEAGSKSVGGGSGGVSSGDLGSGR